MKNNTKKTVLSFLLLFCYNSLTHSVIIIPPQQRADTSTARAVGSLIGTSINLIAQRIRAGKAQEEYIQSIQKSHLENAFADSKKQSLKRLIGPPIHLQEPLQYNFTLLITIIFIAFILVIFFFLKKRLFKSVF